MEEEHKKTKWEIIKTRIYNAYYHHRKILFLIFIFYIILLVLLWNSPNLNLEIQNGGSDNNQSLKKDKLFKSSKILGSPFETTFNAFWWILNQLISLIAIILILIIVPSVPIILYAGALYMVINIMLDKIKTI